MIRHLTDKQKRPILTAVLLLTLLPTILLNKALLPSHTLLPLDLIQTIEPWRGGERQPLQNPLISDPFYSFYPRRYQLTEAIQQGQLPLWNPTTMTGTSNAANPNFQLFYPPNLLAALVLPAHQALDWLAWLHLSLTGIFMFLFLRQHKLNWYACLLGGAVWLLNGYTLVWLENPHRLSTAAWIPGILWAYTTAVHKHTVSWAALAGLLFGLAILGGQMQFIFAISLLLGVYALTTALITFRQNRTNTWPPIGYLALVGLIGLGLGALILLPAAEFSAMSQRATFTPATMANTRWPFSQLITLLAPDFYGNPVRTPYWGVSNYAEMTAYFGAAALLLALTAPFMAQRTAFAAQVAVLTLFVIATIGGTAVIRLFFLFPGAPFIVLTRLLFPHPPRRGYAGGCRF